MKKKRLKKFLHKAVPLWLVFALVINSSLVVSISEYYFMKKQFNEEIKKLSKTTKNPEDLVQIIKQKVLPQNGYTTSVQWKNLGEQMVEAGAIDQKKFEELFTDNANGGIEMKHLQGNSDEKITINEKNSHFIVNFFWALGLVNKSDVLDKGPMMEDPKNLGNFASTGGWTLGSKEATELYSSKTIIPLTNGQQQLVKKIAENVFRPCCGNSTAFPDCNHGMAALGYIEWAVYNKVPETKIYKDLLAFNSFWFPQNYVDLAVYFNEQGKDWNQIDPKIALASNYSSISGAQNVRQSIQNVPGINVQGGGCGA